MTKPNFYSRQNKPKQVNQNLTQPSEDAIQIAIVEWLELYPYKGGTLADYMNHPPNGGVSSPRQKNKFKRMGTKSGYPDIMIDVAKGGYHGLRIELKRLKGGVVSQEQKDRLIMLNDEGYYAVVCRGYDSAIDVITKYMSESIQD